jgi:DNA-directed RNA polymerase specialized sigma subunit
MKNQHEINQEKMRIRNKKVYELRRNENYTWGAIAKRFGITRQRAAQIYDKYRLDHGIRT